MSHTKLVTVLYFSISSDLLGKIQSLTVLMWL